MGSIGAAAASPAPTAAANQPLHPPLRQSCCSTGNDNVASFKASVSRSSHSTMLTLAIVLSHVSDTDAEEEDRRKTAALPRWTNATGDARRAGGAGEVQHQVAAGRRTGHAAALLGAAVVHLPLGAVPGLSAVWLCNGHAHGSAT